jgi:hypothetical protein
MTMPKGSGAVLACTTMSSERSAEGTSSVCPVRPTMPDNPRSATLASSSRRDHWLPEVS